MQKQQDWVAAAQVGDSLCVWLNGAAGVAVLQGQGDLDARLAPHLRAGAVLPVLCSPGVMQAGAVTVPAAPVQACVKMPTPDPRSAFYAVPDMIQDHPADRMGAPLVQVAGFVAAHAGWDGVLCLTGRHSKWVHISAGEVVSFRSFITAELFGLLEEQSSLRRSVDSADWDQPAFEQALAEMMSRPERLAAVMAGLGLHTCDPATARAVLSGTLIGAEMAAARPYWLGQNVALIGSGRLVRHYQSALAAQGVQARCHDGAEMALRGLQAAYEKSEA